MAVNNKCQKKIVLSIPQKEITENLTQNDSSLTINCFLILLFHNLNKLGSCDMKQTKTFDLLGGTLQKVLKYRIK